MIQKNKKVNNYFENLQAILCRTSSIESKIRQVTKEALRELKLKETYCVCRRRVAGVCQNCAEKEVWVQLQTAGYNSAICKSKWKSSPDIPSGILAKISLVMFKNLVGAPDVGGLSKWVFPADKLMT